MEPSTEMRFSGWGTDADAGELSDHVIEWLEQRFGAALGSRVPPPQAADVRLTKSRLSTRAAEKLSSRVGAANVRTDHLTRLTHCAGKGYPDLLAVRAADKLLAPDAVVFPGDESDVRAILKTCAKQGIAVVPFGGGTSVVGGVTPLRGAFNSVISLDLGRMRQLISVDTKSQIGTFAAGLRGPALEHLLQAGAPRQS